jgi:hypothetical protein
MVQEAGVGSRHRMPVCSSEWETNSLAGKTIDLQSLALQWQQTYALSDWSRVKRSAGIQGSSHPGGLRNMAVRIACKGFMSETWKTVTVYLVADYMVTEKQSSVTKMSVELRTGQSEPKASCAPPSNSDRNV